MAFVFAIVCLFCPDSPIELANRNSILSGVIVVVFTFLAHNYDRHLQRRILSKTTNIRRIKSADFSAEHRNTAQEKVLELRKLLSTIDHVWMSSTFLNIFFIIRVLAVERQIIKLIADSNSDELNLIINNIELALLMYKMKDHKYAQCYNRTNLLQLLSVDRVSELAVTSRVVLLDSLQRMKLTAHPQCEEFAKNIILSTKGEQLSELKTLMDSKGDVNSMHKLIYLDIRNKEVQQTILKYIAHQAEIQKAHSKIGSKRGKQRGLLAWRKILSDVDDTLSCAGGSWPAGMDTSYPKKAIYPGVLAFYRELDLGTVGQDEWDNATRVGNLVFLSARPHVYKSVSENVSYDKFRTLQKERGLYTSPSLLAGSLDTGGQFMVKGDSEPLAQKKFENFREYLTLYPEYSCIFIGDNGQGDVRTAELVYRDAVFHSNLQRVYVHQIQPRHVTYCKEPTKTLHDPRMCYFGTYIDAAIDAYQHKLIRASGLRKIMEESCRDFLYIPQTAWLPTHKSSSSSSGVSISNAAAGANRGRSPSLGSADGLTSSVGGVGGAALAPPSSPASSTGSRKQHPNTSTVVNLSAPGTSTKNKAGVASGGADSKKDTFGLLAGEKGKGSGLGTPSKDGANPTSTLPLLTRSFMGKRESMFNIKKLRTGALPAEGLSACSMGFCRGGGIVRTFTSAATEAVNAERKRELRLREINNDLHRGNQIIFDLGLPPVEYLEYTCRYSVGTSVLTMFGEGIITNFRSTDGIYEVLIGWSSKEEEFYELPPPPPPSSSSAASIPFPAIGADESSGVSAGDESVAQEQGKEKQTKDDDEEQQLLENAPGGRVRRVSSGSNGGDNTHHQQRLYGGIKVYIAG
eukprot:CAMPEP_0185006840 /NCGR_PEP_ID=MMETSP1098-20130426/85668_1 /TAXON_ID=89044 /ORGANISM="Spumella elongata, Strain CCAP 955/1" /LENGTH=856 /DNA_ID=CAMNT_0027535075 /DNA_START=328 /DNA_END=2895 /DNA_ORIENTATION=+